MRRLLLLAATTLLAAACPETPDEPPPPRPRANPVRRRAAPADATEQPAREPAEPRQPPPADPSAFRPALLEAAVVVRLVDDEGAPLRGWEVAGLDELGRVVRAVTDEHGAFKLPTSRASALTALAPDGSKALRRALTSRNGDAPLDFATASGAVVAGFVGGGAIGQMPGDRVRVRSGSSGRTWEVDVDRIGAFVVAGLDAEERVDLELSRPGYDDAVAADVWPGTIDVNLTPTPRIRFTRGRVIDAVGRPVKFAWVRFTPTSRGFVVRELTDFDGAFVEQDTLDVDYDVHVLLPTPDVPFEPGFAAGRAHGGDHWLELRLPASSGR